MKKLVSAFLGVFVKIAGLAMIFFWMQTTIHTDVDWSTPVTLDPAFTESIMDKIMWSMICFGAAGGLFIVGFTLVFNPIKTRSLGIAFLGSMIMCAIGLWYTFAFGSPW